MLNLLIVAGGIAALLLLVLRVKLPAFLALLIVSAGVGLALGMDTAAVINSIRDGMASTLGFIAVVVGLGAMFGALLESSGGVRAIADTLLNRFGHTRSTWALGCVGLLVGVPVFFDVAFIILVPIIVRISASTGRAPIYFATPLLAGLAVGHAFIPPTPGPIAVAELLGADLGWVITMGFACGIPAMIAAGPLLARRFRHLSAPTEQRTAPSSEESARVIPVGGALTAILLPLVLIVGNTAGQTMLKPSTARSILEFVGHPFVALLIACLYAYIIFGVRLGVPSKKLQGIMTRALEPAGLIVLVTGAGGVFKQVLIDSGVGKWLGDAFADQALPPVLLGFALAALIRVAQGSATVAMITSAGLVAPILQQLGLSAAHTALVVIAIASGATIASHVNDSGFWLVNRCLEQTEAETLRSWTLISTVAGMTGFATACVLAWAL
jgi:Gnt-I system low-affinity gluconate transporter